eukprot:5580515-Amphidinium_carterae.1
MHVHKATVPESPAPEADALSIRPTAQLLMKPLKTSKTVRPLDLRCNVDVRRQLAVACFRFWHPLTRRSDLSQSAVRHQALNAWSQVVRTILRIRARQCTWRASATQRQRTHAIHVGKAQHLHHTGADREAKAPRSKKTLQLQGTKKGR